MLLKNDAQLGEQEVRGEGRKGLNGLTNGAFFLYSYRSEKGRYNVLSIRELGDASEDMHR